MPVYVYEDHTQEELAKPVLAPLLQWVDSEIESVPEKFFALSDYKGIPIGLRTAESDPHISSGNEAEIYEYATLLLMWEPHSHKIPRSTGKGISKHEALARSDIYSFLTGPSFNPFLEFGITKIFFRLEPKLKFKEVIDYKGNAVKQRLPNDFPIGYEDFTGVRGRSIYCLPAVNTAMACFDKTLKAFPHRYPSTFYNPFNPATSFAEMNDKVDETFHQSFWDISGFDKNCRFGDLSAVNKAIADLAEAPNLKVINDLLLLPFLEIFNDYTMNRNDSFIAQMFIALNSGHNRVGTYGPILGSYYFLKALYALYASKGQDFIDFAIEVLKWKHPRVKLTCWGDDNWIQSKDEIPELDLGHYVVEREARPRFLGHLLQPTDTGNLKWMPDLITAVTNKYVPEYSEKDRNNRPNPFQGEIDRKSRILLHPRGRDLLDEEVRLEEQAGVVKKLHKGIGLSDPGRARWDPTIPDSAKDDTNFMYVSEELVRFLFKRLNELSEEEILDAYYQSGQGTVSIRYDELIQELQAPTRIQESIRGVGSSDWSPESGEDPYFQEFSQLRSAPAGRED